MNETTLNNFFKALIGGITILLFFVLMLTHTHDVAVKQGYDYAKYEQQRAGMIPEFNQYAYQNWVFNPRYYTNHTYEFSKEGKI